MGSTTECLIATMVAARDRYLKQSMAKLKEFQVVLDESEIRKRLVVLGSSETHPATKKAAAVTGVKFRSIPCSPETGVTLTQEHLCRLVSLCLEEGLIPFYLTATIGTTNTCAVDDLAGIGQIMDDLPNMWIHVDAAYAGAALACEEYSHLIARPARLDSLSVNLGK